MSCYRMKDLCTIKRRQATTKYGGTGADKYDVFATDVPCYFLLIPGKTLLQDESGRDLISDGVLRVGQEIIKATDLIIIEDVEYEPLLVQPLKDKITQRIKIYRVFIQRRGDNNADEITIG